jgi:hypothetical protein
MNKKSLGTSDLNSGIKNVLELLWQVNRPVNAKVRNITVNDVRSLEAQINFICAASDFGEDLGDLYQV